MNSVYVKVRFYIDDDDIPELASVATMSASEFIDYVNNL